MLFEDISETLFLVPTLWKTSNPDMKPSTRGLPRGKDKSHRAYEQIEEMEERVRAKMVERAAVGRTMLETFFEKSQKNERTGPRHIFPPSALRKFVLTIPKSWNHPP